MCIDEFYPLGLHGGELGSEYELIRAVRVFCQDKQKVCGSLKRTKEKFWSGNMKF